MMDQSYHVSSAKKWGVLLSIAPRTLGQSQDVPQKSRSSPKVPTAMVITQIGSENEPQFCEVKRQC